MTQPQPAVEPEAPPPQDSTLVQQIVTLLLIGAGIKVTIDAIQALLSPLGLSAKAVGAATRLALSVGPTNIDPTGLPGSPFEAPRSDGKATRNTFQSEVFFRAAYLLNAAKRLEKSLARDESLIKALRAERRYFLQHRDAQSRRADAARRVDVAAQVYGDLLGWHSKDDARVSAECKAANGKNFNAGVRPRIGYPGTVHPHCRCLPGAPFTGAGMLPVSRRPPARVRKVA